MKGIVKEILITTAFSVVMLGSASAEIDTTQRSLAKMTMKDLLENGGNLSDNAKGFVDKTRNILIEFSNRFNTKSSEHEALKHEHDISENEKKELQLKYASLESSLNDVKSQLSSVDAKREALEKEKKELAANHNASKEEVNALNAKIKDMDRARNTLESEHKTLQNKHDALQSEHSNLQNEHDSLKKNHDELQRDHEELEDINETLQSEHDKLKIKHNTVLKVQEARAEEDRKAHDELERIQNERKANAKPKKPANRISTQTT